MSQETTVTAEIQSVNKRQTEILINLPSALTSLESDLRAKIDRSLHRGRIIVTIGIKPTEPATGYGYIHVGETLPAPAGVKKYKTTFAKVEP